MKIKQEIILAFVLGIIVGATVVSIWSYLTITMYPYGMMSNYMMPMMGRNMMSTVGCQTTDVEFEELGEKIMEQMMGKELDEQIEARMTNETITLMHTTMGRMWSGC